MRVDPFRKKIVWKALLISLGYIGISVVLGLQWETNDDPAIAILLSREDNDYSPFQWRLLSIFLHSLYIKLPVIDWWAVCSVVSIWLCAFVTVLVIFRRFDRTQAAIILLPVLVMLWFTALYRVNFTRTAAVVSMAGSLLIADSVFDEEVKRSQWILYCAGILLMLLGASIRKQSAMIALGFLAVIGLLGLVRDHFRVSVKWFHNHLRQIVMLCMAAAAFFGACVIHDQILTPEQEQYIEYNRKRSSIQDYSSLYPEYEEAADEYAAAGINQSAYDLLFGWTSEDTEVFTNDVLDQVIQLRTMETSISGGTSVLQNHKLITFLAITLILLVSLNRKYGFVSALAVVGMAVLLCAYLCFEGRFPVRVYMSVLWSAVSAGVFLAGKRAEPTAERDTYCEPEERNGENWIKRRISAVLILGCVMNGGLGLWRICNCVAVDHNPAVMARDESERIYNRQLCDLIEEDREHLYIFDMGNQIASLNSSFSFWEPKPTKYGDNRFCLGGWNARHPYRLELMERYGFDNPMRALFERTDVYSTYSLQLLRHLRNSYGCRMSVSEVAELNGIPLVQYTFALDDRHLILDESTTVVLDEFSYRDDRQTDAWYISAMVDSNESDSRTFFCNITVNGLRYTYQLDYEEGVISGYLYEIGEHFNVESADIRFFEKIDGSYYVYNFA